MDPLTALALYKLFFDKNPNGAAARPADVHVPPAPPPVQALPPQPTQPSATPAQPTFPVNVVVPPPPPPAPVAPPGMKKAVEVWQVKPEIAAAAGVLAGAGPAQAAAFSLPALEANFPNGWTPCKVVTATEVQTARAMLSQWRDGGVAFLGPGTLQGRRAYRMTKHGASAPAPQPVPVQPAAGPTVPASTSQEEIQRIPTSPPSTSNFPERPPPPPPPPQRPAASPTAPPSAQITTVRPGEGLAQAAKRMGQPESADSAKALRSANVPQGPDAQWKSVDLSKGGLLKAGRTGKNAAGLHAGDHLFVPAAWGFIDPARL